MKALSLLKAALLFVAIPFLFGCEKETLSELKITTENQLGKTGKGVEKPLKGKMISSTYLEGDTASGWADNNLLPAWLYGSGEGNATHIGKYTAYFSQYATTVEQNVAYVTGVPVTMFFREELLENFSEAEVDLMEELEVSIVLVDKHGNSIWGIRFPETRAVDPEIVEDAPVYQKLKIVGGTGRFAEASGQFTLEGFSDLSFSGPGLGRLEINGVLVY
ncbi:hypothetical protein [Pontibacter ruber]|uniref:Uncharacterized protein n=1 Tax=Pontibacter ruber TaxID=1343895 RepID=A0ABW5D108_9BACT|nr:hypothetical protein [Pontibacter ruber]